MRLEVVLEAEHHPAHHAPEGFQFEVNVVEVTFKVLSSGGSPEYLAAHVTRHVIGVRVVVVTVVTTTAAPAS